MHIIKINNAKINHIEVKVLFDETDAFGDTPTQLTIKTSAPEHAQAIRNTLSYLNKAVGDDDARRPITNLKLDTNVIVEGDSAQIASTLKGAHFISDEQQDEISVAVGQAIDSFVSGDTESKADQISVKQSSSFFQPDSSATQKSVELSSEEEQELKTLITEFQALITKQPEARETLKSGLRQTIEHAKALLSKAGQEVTTGHQ